MKMSGVSLRAAARPMRMPWKRFGTRPPASNSAIAVMARLIWPRTRVCAKGSDSWSDDDGEGREGDEPLGRRRSTEPRGSVRGARQMTKAAIAATSTSDADRPRVVDERIGQQRQRAQRQCGERRVGEGEPALAGGMIEPVVVELAAVGPEADRLAVHRQVPQGPGGQGADEQQVHHRDGEGDPHQQRGDDHAEPALLRHARHCRPPLLGVSARARTTARGPRRRSPPPPTPARPWRRPTRRWCAVRTRRGGRGCCAARARWRARSSAR